MKTSMIQGEAGKGKGNQSLSLLSKPISSQTYQKSSTSQQHLWLLACSCEGNPPCSSSSTPLLFFSFISIGDLDIKAMDLKAVILHTSLFLLIILLPQNTSSPAHPLTQHPRERQQWGVQSYDRYKKGRMKLQLDTQLQIQIEFFLLLLIFHL